MQAEGTLKISQDLIGIPVRIVVRDDTISLDGRAGIARIMRCHRNAAGSRGESSVGIAVNECAIADQIAAHRLV